MTERKKPINSKAKGSEFERRVAKVLSKWWGEEFHRTPASGGLHWHEDNRVAGDIVTPEKSKFPFTVECKKREEWMLEQIIKGTGEIEKWWTQALGDSERVGLKPLLIFSKNFAPNYVMMHLDDFMGIDIESKVEISFFTFYKNGSSRAILLLDDLVKIKKDSVMTAFNL